MTTAWMVAAGVLMISMVPCGVVCVRAGVLDALVALELAGAVTTLTLLALAVAMGRPLFLDVALVGALLSFTGGLAFARFLERWV